MVGFLQIVVEDTMKIENSMDQQLHYASKFALELRLEIWKELFGFEKHEMMDPINEDFWKALKERSKVN